MSEGVWFLLTVMLTSCSGEPPVEEFVFPRILEARGANGEKMLHIRDGLTLSLEKSKVFSENFVFSMGDDVNYSNSSVNVKKIEESLYHDRKYGSSVVVQESNGHVQVRGILTDTLSIEPASSYLRSKDGIVAHLISKFNDTSIPMYADYVEYTNVTQRQFWGDNHREGRQRRRYIPQIVFIETRILYDDAFQKLKGSNLSEYLGIIMNKVNVLYSYLRTPRPHFLIVGIHKLWSKAHLKLTHGTLLEVCNSIKPLNDFVYRSWRHDAHDVVAFVSGIPHSPKYDNAVGCTNLCGICSKRKKVTVQTVHGLNDESSARLIAHELGHEVGMEHEGEHAGNAGHDCGLGSGFVMAPNINMHGRFAFSDCAYKEMKNCLWSKDERCLARTAKMPS